MPIGSFTQLGNKKFREHQIKYCVVGNSKLFSGSMKKKNGDQLINYTATKHEYFGKHFKFLWVFAGCLA